MLDLTALREKADSTSGENPVQISAAELRELLEMIEGYRKTIAYIGAATVVAMEESRKRAIDNA